LEESPVGTIARTTSIPSKLDRNYVSDYTKGDYVNHHKFGTGPVLLVDGAKLTVDFPVGRKRVIDDFVSPALPPPDLDKL
jgi:DNA helicase-2/ATP-dependent DNA helicase PcrA